MSSHRRRPRLTTGDRASHRYASFLKGCTIDQDGNAYKESIVRMPGPSPVPKPKSWDSVAEDDYGGTGARRLSSCVRKVISEHLMGLSVEALQATPCHLAQTIWNDAEATRHGSLELWAMFMEAYKDEKDAEFPKLRRLTLREMDPLLPVISRISSVDCAFLVLLDLRCITGAALARDDLIDISQIPNLAVLLISGLHKDALIDDSIVLSWSSAALHSGKFKRLWFLSITCCPHVTHRSLEYLSKVPNLRVVDLGGCSLDRNQQNADWIRDRRIAPLDGGVTVDDGLAEIWKQVSGSDDGERETPRLYVSWDGRDHGVGIKRRPMVFRRTPYSNGAQKRDAATADESGKLEIDGTEKNIGEPAAKKRPIRASKRVDMNDMLAEFLNPPRRPGRNG